MAAIKYNRVYKLSKTAKYPQTFDARIQSIPDWFWETMTAKQIAAIIDGPMQASYMAGYNTGYEDAQ